MSLLLVPYFVPLTIFLYFFPFSIKPSYLLLTYTSRATLVLLFESLQLTLNSLYTIQIVAYCFGQFSGQTYSYYQLVGQQILSSLVPIILLLLPRLSPLIQLRFAFITDQRSPSRDRGGSGLLRSLKLTFLVGVSSSFVLASVF